MKMGVKHNCPYLEHGIICTHITLDPSKSSTRRRCNYKHIEHCPLLRNSKSVLPCLLEALEVKVDSKAISVENKGIQGVGVKQSNSELNSTICETG